MVRVLAALLPALSLAAAVTAAAVSARAAPFAAPGDLVRVDLLPGWRQADGTHMAALRFDLAPGWKTYWRAPGETGLAPRFDWSGSENAAAVEPVWPRPRMLEANGVRTIGYGGSLVLPLAVVTADPGAPVALHGSLSIGVCEDICVPVEIGVSGVLPALSAAADPAIAAALADRPLTAAEAGVAGVACRFEVEAGGHLSLSATIDLPAAQPPRRVAVVEPGSPGLWASDATLRRDGRTLAVAATLGGTVGDGTPWIDRDAIRITLIGPNDAVDIRGCPAPGR